MKTVEELVERVGEPARPLIKDAIQYLDTMEPAWGLDEPIDREEYIESILERAHKETELWETIKDNDNG